MIAEGTVEQVRANKESITGRYLRGELEIPIPEVRRRMDRGKVIRIEGARELIGVLAVQMGPGLGERGLDSGLRLV